MALRIVRLGSPRSPDEGLRIGVVRRPPRGVLKAELAMRDWYDLWFPTLAPSAKTLALWKADPVTEKWPVFAKHYRTEMTQPEARHAIALLAALSHRTDLSVGCYCDDATHCHRSLLRELLAADGACIG